MSGIPFGTCHSIRAVACILALLAALAFTGEAVAVPEAPVSGTVTMLELGAKSCIPCKMMLPIINALETEYKDKAAIVFIDVWENPDQVKRFGIRSIPTQIFYDRQGKEFFRHEGFFDKAPIVEILDKLLAQ